MTDRRETLRRLASDEFDLCVVGGGVTGAGIARDAALRGLKVCVVEKGDLARGTSSASSKLIHGGLRYLEQLELSLVREGVRERSLLMRNAAHLARPLPFLFPIFKDSRAGPFKVHVGMWLYDALALFGNYKRHRMLTRRETERAEPALRRNGLRASTVYYDCLTDDARLTVETTADGAARGACVATHCEVMGFRRSGGRVTGVLVRDRLAPADLGDDLGPAPPANGGGFEVKAKLVVSATGPWTDKLLASSARKGRLLRPTKGVHVVLDRARLAVDHAVVMTAVKDGRVLFAIPWGPRTVFGTTDTDDDQGAEQCRATASDVAYLLETANHFFPGLRATGDDVISTWAGLRPLIAQDAVKESQVSREHEILEIEPGLLAIAGGKLTTYRLMAEQVVDRSLELLGRQAKCTTETTPLPGAQDPEQLEDLPAFATRLGNEHHLDPDVATHLAHAYGLRAKTVLAIAREPGTPQGRIVPDLPHLWAEVLHAARHDLAQRLDDVLRRRTLVFLRAHDQGLAAAPEAARLLAHELGWDAERTKLELQRYEGVVAASRAWRGQAEPAPAPVR